MNGRSHDDELLDVARALVVDATAAAALRALAAAGLPCLLLRGPVLAQLLYDAPAERQYVDVDLLVDPARLADAEAALAAAGFVESTIEAAFPEGRPRHAHTWRVPSGSTVDLHRTLIGIQAPADMVWGVLERDSQVAIVQGVNVRIPSVPARALIVALHAAHHVDDAGPALRDLEQALVRLPPGIWSEAALLAGELDSTETFAAGLSLNRRGVEEARRLGVRPAAWQGSGEYGDRSFHVAQGIAWLGSMPGLRAKSRYLWRRIFPSPRSMRRRSRIARRGVAGLFLAYVARWLDALRHLPAALSALRRAQR